MANMYLKPILVTITALSLTVLNGCHGLQNGLCITPPMGYNNYMGKTALMPTAEYFVSSGLIHSGYEFVNSDEGWEQKNRSSTTGKIVPGPKYGNSDAGMIAFVDKIHSMGLKVGMYGAASGVTCGKYPGQLYHEDIDAETYASWGLDFLKSDNCASYALDSSVRFGAMRDALNRTGRKIVLSIEPFSINPDPEMSVKVSNVWRIACDIQSNWPNIINRADISDKWSPLAGPGGWNDPDMINVKNPPELSLGENRVYFGLWSIMKSPLLLSSDLPNLVSDIIDIVNNTEAIAINQDKLGVQARKLYVNGTVLPWRVGLKPCDSAPKKMYNRALQTFETEDPREWSVMPQTNKDEFLIKGLSTNRCLGMGAKQVNIAPGVNLVPCDPTDTNQVFGFGKGLHSPSSVFHVASNMALAIGNDTLHSGMYNTDEFATPSASYGDVNLTFVPRYEQDGCTTRDCQNYDNTQMWYYDPTEKLLRATTFTASINHKNDGKGYELTQKVPTFQHHCLAHTLSTDNEGTDFGETEVWGGPLDGGDFVMAALNRGSTNTTINIAWEMLEVASASASTKFDVRDVWAKTTIYTGQAMGFKTHVDSHDIKIFRLSPSK